MVNISYESLSNSLSMLNNRINNNLVSHKLVKREKLYKIHRLRLIETTHKLASKDSCKNKPYLENYLT